MNERKIILIVDPDHQTRVEVRRFLEDLGHFVVSATQGTEAFSLIQNMTVPSLILMATNLSAMSGEEFMTMLKRHPEFADIPVAQLIARFEKSIPGVTYAIEKPLDRSKLLEAVNAV